MYPAPGQAQTPPRQPTPAQTLPGLLPSLPFLLIPHSADPQAKE
jgi:hypothetical protein